LIDDVRIYRAALTRLQIEAMMQETEALFQRGDANSDSFVDIADVVFTFAYLFVDGATPECLDATDTNDDGMVDLADAVYALQFMFAEGPAIPWPNQGCGADPTADDLDCAIYPFCRR
jgi:hypothetical protein